MAKLLNHLAAYRKNIGLNQQELARLADVSRQTISLIERGDYNPSVTLALRLAAIFGVTVEQLFFLKEDASMFYCTSCQTVCETPICPHCGKKKLTSVKETDELYLGTLTIQNANLLCEALEEEGILYRKVPTQGAGITMRIGTMFESFAFYILYRDLERVEQLWSNLFKADAAEE